MIYDTQEFAQLVKEMIADKKRHDLYEETVKHAKEMSVHINGDKPLYLLERARPREDDEVKTYRIENYEPTTKAGADRAIKIVSKGFNPALYSITWLDQSTEAKELQEYTLEYYPRCNSIMNFNKDVVLRKMLADPNGVIAVKPEDIPEDDTEKLQPITVVYGSCKVWWYDKDGFVINVREPEKEDPDQSYEFEYYDKMQYINFTALYDGSDKSVEFTEKVWYKHNGKKLPVWFLGGESKNLDNGKLLYQSYFSAALPHWNLAVIHESDLLGAYITHMHPHKYELAEECAFKFDYEGISYPCHGGTIRYPGGRDGASVDMSCNNCGGTGLSTVRSPYQSYLFSKNKLDEGQSSGILPVGFITIPTEATAMLEARTDKMNQKAMAAINMDIEEKIGENQSGVAKVIDRSAQYDTIADIISRVFDVHVNDEYYFINMYLNGVVADSLGKSNDKNLPEVSKPTKFEVLSVADRIFNFKVSKDSGLDRNILRVQAKGIIESDNGSNPMKRDYLIAMIDLDPLYGFTVDEIDLGVMKGVIRKVDWSIHDNINQFVDRAISQDNKFLEKDKQDQIAVLEKFGNELITSEKPAIDESIMLPFGEDEQNAA